MLPVARFMDELVTAINGSYQSDLGGQCPARRGYQETQSQKEQTERSIWISPETWRPVGQVGDLRLEAHTLNLRFVRTSSKPENEPLDEDVEAAFRLREKLECFVGQNGRDRVDNILGPLTIDRAKLAANQSAIGMTLDCDILYGRAYCNDSDEGSPVLTNARRAVWDAIENWPHLYAKFKTSYADQDDLAMLQLRDPGPRELPAIALYWGPVKPEWFTHRMQEWPLTLRLSVWVHGDQHTYAEELIEKVCDAVYQSTPTGDTRSYVRKATGYPPRRVEEMNVQTVTLGRAQLVHAIRADVAFVLRSNKDPFGDGETT